MKNTDFDLLVTDEIYLCKNYNKMSPYVLQRLLGIDLDIAARIFDELQGLRLIVNVRTQEYDKDTVIADVNKEKLMV